MTTDQQLLELAARAYGLPLTQWDCIGQAWNPLTDDGDALRLVVRLGLNIDIEPFEAVAYYAIGKFVREAPTMGYSLEEATRRAIVRAAALIAVASQKQP